VTVDRGMPSTIVRVIPDGSRDGERVDVSKVITSGTYQDCDNKADKLTLRVDNYDVSAYDNPIWKKGNIIEVSWGYPGAMAPTRRCIIQKVTGFRELSIEANGLEMLLAATTKARTWEGMTHSEIAAAIAQEWGYASEMQVIESTEERYETISQARMSDAAFIKKLAQRNGFVFYLDAAGFHFHRRLLEQRTHRIYTYFTEQKRGVWIDFRIENDITAKPGRVRAKGRDPLNKTDISESGDAEWPFTGLRPVPEAVQNEVLRLADEAEARWRALLRGVQATVEAGGDATTQRIVAENERRVAVAYRDAAEGHLAVDPDSGAVVFSPTAPAGTWEGSAQAQTAYRSIVEAGIAAITPSDLSSRAASEDTEPTSESTAGGAARRARGRQTRVQLTTVKAKLTVEGDPTLLAKSVIELRGIGTRLSGAYYVAEVRHKFCPAPYTCELDLRSDGTNGYGEPELPEAARETSRDVRTVMDEEGLQPGERVDPATGERYYVWNEEGYSPEALLHEPRR
jgi:phage protein D